MKYYTVNDMGGSGRPILFFKSFINQVEAQAASGARRVLTPAHSKNPPETARLWVASQCQTDDTVDHVPCVTIHGTRIMKHGRTAPVPSRKKSILTAKGAGVRSQGAKIQTHFDSTGAQASGRKQK